MQDTAPAQELCDTAWMAAMRSLDFAHAWQISDTHLGMVRKAGLDKHSGPRHQQIIWRGETLNGKHVLVRCYHGLGDTLQFVRFIAPLRELADEVSLWAQPELLEVLEGVPGLDRILPLHDGTPDVAFDADIEVMEIPHALRINRSHLGNPPYISAPQATAHPIVLSAPPEALRVGLVWESGAWRPGRMISPDLLWPLLALPEVQFFSLRPGAAATSRLAIADASSTSIATLAATMRALDVVVSVDTMTAHLAGALSLNAWTLLQHQADWRWGATSRTPWYPTMRLFRQRLAGDWSQPLAEVAQALRDAKEAKCSLANIGT